MKTSKEKIDFLARLAEQTEFVSEKQIVDYGTDDERYGWVSVKVPTKDALAARRILTVLEGYDNGMWRQI